MINPPWNKDNLNQWLYRRGKTRLIQLRSPGDPFTDCNASSPEDQTEEMVSSMSCHWLLVRIKKGLSNGV